MKNGANQYKQTSITTASRGKLLIMLYEAALRHIKKGIECIEKKDSAGKGLAIGKTHDIVNELINSLNFEVGGDLAKELERLYGFVIDQLIKANTENSVQALQNSEKVLGNLLEGWRGAVQQFEKENGK